MLQRRTIATLAWLAVKITRHYSYIMDHCSQAHTAAWEKQSNLLSLTILCIPNHYVILYTHVRILLYKQRTVQNR